MPRRLQAEFASPQHLTALGAVVVWRQVEIVLGGEPALARQRGALRSPAHPYFDFSTPMSQSRITAPTVAVTSDPMNADGFEAEQPEGEATDQRTDHTDDQVADQSEPAAAHDLAGEPASNQTNDQKSDYSHRALLLPSVDVSNRTAMQGKTRRVSIECAE